MSNNSTVLQKVRDKIGWVNRALVTLAFMGCVNELSAKNPEQQTPTTEYSTSKEAAYQKIVGDVIDVDGSNVYMKTNVGEIKVTSPSLVAAYTRAVQGKNRGGVAFVEFYLDKNTSEIGNGKVGCTPVRVTSGVRDARWDIRNIGDDVAEIVNDVRDINIGRTVRKVGEMTQNYSSERFQGGIVRVKAQNPEKPGTLVWVQFHKVRNGRILPQFQKGSAKSNDGYQSQNYNSGTKTISLSQLSKIYGNGNSSSYGEN